MARSYQWYRNGVAINGANTTTYRLTANDVGCNVHCVVTAANNTTTRSANTPTVTNITSRFDRNILNLPFSSTGSGGWGIPTDGNIGFYSRSPLYASRLRWNPLTFRG